MTDAIPKSVRGCPHGCKREIDCLRYDQGGSIPADCPLAATPNSVPAFQDTPPHWQGFGHSGDDLKDATRIRGTAQVIAQATLDKSWYAIPGVTIPQQQARAVLEALRVAGFHV